MPITSLGSNFNFQLLISVSISISTERNGIQLKKNKEKLNWINSTLFIGRSEHFQKQEAKSNSTVQKKKSYSLVTREAIKECSRVYPERAHGNSWM
jgi:hypothetical protein